MSNLCVRINCIQLILEILIGDFPCRIEIMVFPGCKNKHVLLRKENIDV